MNKYHSDGYGINNQNGKRIAKFADSVDDCERREVAASLRGFPVVGLGVGAMRPPRMDDWIEVSQKLIKGESTTGITGNGRRVTVAGRGGVFIGFYTDEFTTFISGDSGAAALAFFGMLHNEGGK